MYSIYVKVPGNGRKWEGLTLAEVLRSIAALQASGAAWDYVTVTDPAGLTYVRIAPAARLELNGFV